MVIKYKRITREVPCPKEAKLIGRLDECEESGRIVIFAGFQGALDRIQNICHKRHWSVVRCDGRGWHVTTSDGKLVKVDKPLHYWKDCETNPRVAFVAHPQSGGLSLNLTESRMSVFWSNDFNPESRSQAEDRIHRMGMDENRGCKIVDLFHLPSDIHVRNILLDNRRLELMTMGEFNSLESQMA
jgi:SNF2 family DNA or RNA helicase